MVRFLISSLISYCAFVGVAQEEQAMQWTLIDSIPVQEEAVWTVDILGNMYISENSVINKYDSTGARVFSQSIKSFGKLSALCVINTMKLVYFSEDQQLLCYLDNTLSKNENCIRLEERDITFATAVSSSDRSNKLWLLDEINSRLVLIDLESEMSKSIVIENITTIVGEGDGLSLIEKGGRLYVNNPQTGIFVFDIYGTFIDLIDKQQVSSMDADESGLYLLGDRDHLVFISNRTGEEIRLELPRQNCVEIQVKGKLLYLRTPNFVYKYSVELSN